MTEKCISEYLMLLLFSFKRLQYHGSFSKYSANKSVLTEQLVCLLSKCPKSTANFKLLKSKTLH